MTTLAWVILITTVAGVGGTGLGGLVGALFRKDSNKTVSLLLAFAGGVMLAVVCFDLITQAMAQETGLPTLPVVMVGLLLGYCVVFLLNDVIDESTNHEVPHIDENHPRTADSPGELIHADHFQEHRKRNDNYQLLIGGLVMAAAIALHNLPEGMVIGASYAAQDGAAFTVGSGFIIAIVIGLHNIPEGMAVSVPLITGGMRRSRAVLLTALTGAPTILGAVLGYCVGAVGPLALAISLSFASGAMLYVVLGELIPEAVLMWRSKVPAFSTLVGILVGLFIIYS